MRLQRLCLAAFLLLSVPLAAEVPSAVAIKDAHVVTVSGGDLAKGTIILRGGLIAGVGASVKIPSDAWVIEGAGLTVYPGFIDALGSWGIPAPAPITAGRTAGAGGTPPATESRERRINGPEDRPQTYAFERAADLITPSDSKLEAARAVGFTTSATFPNRGIVEGLGAMINLAGEQPGDMVVAQPVAEQVIFRVGGGGFGRSFPSSLMGHIAYIRQLYADLAQHRQAAQIYGKQVLGTRRPPYDHNLEALAQAPHLLLPADESQQIERMLRFGQELHTPFVLYGLHEGFGSVDLLKRARVPVLVSLKWPTKPKDGDPNEIPNYRDLVTREQAPLVPGKLSQAGVKFAFYSDGVNTAPELKSAIKKAVDGGLQQPAAIRALTLSAAEIYGLDDRLGSIDKGKIANLVVTKGDAFAEKTTVEYVFIDGQVFEPAKTPPSPKPGDNPKMHVAESDDLAGGAQ